MSLIKEAQTLIAIGDKIGLYKEVQTIIKGSTLDTVANILKENESFGVTPKQIHDQVHQHLAPAAGKNGQALSQRQFNTLANQFRLELEDEYSEIYPASEWKRLVARAWDIHNQAHLTGQENEEQTEHPYQAGWTAHGVNQGRDACPHKMGSPAHQDWHEGYSDAYDAKNEENEEKGWPSDASVGQDNDDDDDHEGNPNADGTYGRRYDALPHASDNFFGNDEENEEFHRDPEPHEKQSLYGPTGREAPATNWFDRDVYTKRMNPRQEKDENMARIEKGPQTPLTQEQKGWYDAQFNKEMASQDPEYVTGYDRYKKTGSKPWEKNTQENEESGKPTILQSLLSQKKTATQKANTALKQVESEGAKAFHEHRMAGMKSPYNSKKESSSHETWTRGWSKAAAEHYAPAEVDTKAKKKVVKK
jgi:hypothetical protein